MADLRKLKDKAAEHLAKGRFAKAAEALTLLVKAEPKDIALRQKLGDALRKGGQAATALRVYQDVADRYARDGQLLKAVAICKLVLELDPNHAKTQERLAELYARKQGVGVSIRGMAAAPVPEPAPDREEEVELSLAPAPMGGARAIELPPEAEGATPPEVLDASGLPAELEVQSPAERTGPPVAPRVPAFREVELPLEDQALPEMEIPVELAPEAPGAAAEPSPPDGPPSAAGDQAPAPPAATPFEAILGAARDRAAAEGEALLLTDPVFGDGEPEEVPAPAPPSAAPAAPAAPPVSLPRIPLFSDLPHDAFVALAERIALVHVPAGGKVVEEGQPGTSFYVVVSGSVRVEKGGPEGRPVALAQLGEGSFFGEMAILSGAPRAATVLATEDCDLLEIRADVLLDLAREHPQVVESLARFYRRRLLANAMSTSPVFRPFDRAQRAEIMARFRTREVPVGASVVTEGEPSDGLYVVLSGALDVWKRREGEQALAARLHEGDVFGEMSCLRKGPASATVMAARRCVLLRLPRSDFDELVVTYPQILELVSELVDERQHTLEAIAAGQARLGEDGLLLV